MSQPKMLRDMYGIGVSESHIYEEMNNFVPHIHAWSQRYLGSGLILSGEKCTCSSVCYFFTLILILW